ncbi:hypothetical protein BH23CHL5_BH23CHL5_12430 [soil metagenome]
MCLVLILALAGTSYLAVYFNRKAKDDLGASLSPLARMIEGTVDLDEATISGRYLGHLTEARVSTLPGGMGRVFLISLVDGAGGSGWTWTLTRSKEPGLPPSGEFESEVKGIAEATDQQFESLTRDPTMTETWFRVAYAPDAGTITLTKPMQNRRDIPRVEEFARLLDEVHEVAAANRSVQGPEVLARVQPEPLA